MLRVVQVALPASRAETLCALLEEQELIAEWQQDARNDVLPADGEFALAGRASAHRVGEGQGAALHAAHDDPVRFARRRARAAVAHRVLVACVDR